MARFYWQESTGSVSQNTCRATGGNCLRAPGHILVPLKCSSRNLQLPCRVPQGENAFVPLPFHEQSIQDCTSVTNVLDLGWLGHYVGPFYMVWPYSVLRHAAAICWGHRKQRQCQAQRNFDLCFQTFISKAEESKTGKSEIIRWKKMHTHKTHKGQAWNHRRPRRTWPSLPLVLALVPFAISKWLCPFRDETPGLTYPQKVYNFLG